MNTHKLLLVMALGLGSEATAAVTPSDTIGDAPRLGPANPAPLALPTTRRNSHLAALPAGTDSGMAYRVGRSWGLMAGLHQVPTGQPLAVDASPALRSSFTQPGLGVSYGVSPKLRFISGWHRGVGASTVSPGNQFTVGISLR